MNMMSWNGPERLRSLIVLGAGASRGASFVHDASCYEARPPLDCDFFSELQRLDKADNVKKNVDELLRFVRREFRVDLSLSMEQFFSQVEYTDRFHNETKIDRGPKILQYQKALDWFYRSLPILLSQTTENKNCKYHKQLVTNLHTNDVILSFNYDCLIDTALRDGAGKRWNPKKGYGCRVKSGDLHWCKRTGRGRDTKNSIALLKLHGSLNWRISKGQVILRRNSYGASSAKGNIIPPTWFKYLNKDPYKSVWRRTRREIRKCRALIVIGYSMPSMDLFSHALFKTEISSKIEREDKIEYLVIANPDPSARQRFIDLMGDGMGESTRVLQFDSLRELAHSLRNKNM